MVAIRLMRLGAKKRPFYRVIVTDSRRPRESKAKEILGFYDPLKEPVEINILAGEWSKSVQNGSVALK